MIIGVVVVAAVFTLGYVAVSLQGQISTLTMQLEAGKVTKKTPGFSVLIQRFCFFLYDYLISGLGLTCYWFE